VGEELAYTDSNNGKIARSGSALTYFSQAMSLPKDLQGHILSRQIRTSEGLSPGH
jgi:hypothetical protein